MTMFASGDFGERGDAQRLTWIDLIRQHKPNSPTSSVNGSAY